MKDTIEQALRASYQALVTDVRATSDTSAALADLYRRAGVADPSDRTVGPRRHLGTRRR